MKSPTQLSHMCDNKVYLELHLGSSHNLNLLLLLSVILCVSFADCTRELSCPIPRLSSVMSVSSLPEWKQILLERKRREEEEREKREKQEEEKLASMPAWKRGIIQRRKAKQESSGEVCPVEACSPSDGLSDTDSSVTVNLGSDISLSPDPGTWLDADSKPASQVSVETIVPVHENPFIRTQSVWKRGREVELCSPKGYDGETGRGRDIELKIERFRDLSEGRDKERSRDRSQRRETSRDRSNTREKDRNQWKDSLKDKDFLKVRKDDEDQDTDSASPVYSPHVPCLRTIRADNIIIIEQDRKSSNEEKRGRWREAERDRSEEEPQTKKGLKMDFKEILAGGGSVTEIRASEVLIIKPPACLEDRGKVMSREDTEKMDGRREGRELRADMSWLREKLKETAKEKERPWGQATVIKEDKKDNMDDNVFVEKGGRVSQLLSKFGEHRKPPSRSKSSDNFLKPGRRKLLDDEEDVEEAQRVGGRNMHLITVPKRSFSFSDRVFSAKENGFDEEGQIRERIHSVKSPWMEVGSLGRETAGKIKMGCARLLEKDRFGKNRHWQNKDKAKQNRKKDLVDKSAAENIDRDEGFTVACVKNIEGVSFAKRVPIRQEGKTRPAERGVKKVTAMEVSGEKDAKVEGQDCDKKGGFESRVHGADLRHESAFTECSSLICTVTDTSNRSGPDWRDTGMGPRALLASTLQTEDCKLKDLGDAKEKVEKSSKTELDVAKNLEETFPSDGRLENQEARGSSRIPSLGVQPGPLEIQIPRTVFYVAEEMVDKKPNEGQDWEAGKGVERRDSWRIGKPLSRIESLKEKIRQRELETMKQREAKDQEDVEVAEICDSSSTDQPAEAETEREVESQTGKSVVNAEKEASEVAMQTSMPVFDVTQEVSISKASPQLPVSIPEADRGAEVTSSGEVCTDSYQLSEEHDELSQGDSLDEEREDSEEDEEEFAADFESGESLSFSPPHPNSLEAMSRIYNLETVGSRSGLCLRDRTSEIPSVHLVRVKPLNSQQGEGCGVKTIQRHIERFQLKDQEALKTQQAPCTSPNSFLKETKSQNSPRGKPLKDENTSKDQDKDVEFSPRLSPRQVNSPDQTITINSSILRCQSPENALKISDLAPTPASSPCSPSPAQSPSVSPSPSPTLLFSIRSASGGQVKRGTTITITPKKCSPVGGSSSSAPTTAIKKNPSVNTPTSSAEQAKKKYPTVEEIEVIGGYQNLDKSCLVKNKGTPKKVSWTTTCS